MSYPRLSFVTPPERVGRDGTPSKARALVLVARETPWRTNLVCFGPPSHRRRDGRMCRHVADVLAVMRPWHRQRTWVQLPAEAKEDAVRAA